MGVQAKDMKHQACLVWTGLKESSSYQPPSPNLTTLSEPAPALGPSLEKTPNGSWRRRWPVVRLGSRWGRWELRGDRKRPPFR